MAFYGRVTFYLYFTSVLAKRQKLAAQEDDVFIPSKYIIFIYFLHGSKVFLLILFQRLVAFQWSSPPSATIPSFTWR